MRAAARRSSMNFIALSLCAGLTSCGGNGSVATLASSSTLNPAVSARQSTAATFSLGLVPADPRTIAHMAHIRHALGAASLPQAADLSQKMPPVGNQGQEGSCVAWASAYALRGYEARQDVWSNVAPKTIDPAHNFSPAFVYNQVNGGRDAGTSIPTVMTLLQQKGAATLADMPYVAGQFKTQPSAAASADAVHYKIASYGYIAPTDLVSMKAQLAAGLPVVLAIKVYNNFFQLGSNQIYSSTAGGYAGGHAITAVGYDDRKQAVEIINSWGPYWGTAGYGWISYSALSQIALEAYSAIDDHGAPAPTPSVTPPVPSPTPTIKPSPSPTPTVKPSPNPIPTTSPSPTPTPTPTPTVKPSPVPTPPVKPSPSPAPTSTTKPSPAASPTSTSKPSPTPT